VAALFVSLAHRDRRDRNPPLVLALGARGGAALLARQPVRGDVALRHLLGWKRLLGDHATRAFFGRFGWKKVDAFFPSLTT
jgi:hypothetical protein